MNPPTTLIYTTIFIMILNSHFLYTEGGKKNAQNYHITREINKFENKRTGRTCFQILDPYSARG